MGQEQFLVEDLFFVTDESRFQRRLRRIYVALSFIPYLLGNLGILVRPLVARLRP
jgi:hypothetical protein